MTAIEIDSGFPGGNTVVERVDGERVMLHQDLRDTAHDWFYWCFRVRGAAGQTLRFQFTQGRALGVRGPAASLDQGLTWEWVGAGAVDGNAFSYAFPIDAADVRFSFAMPYQQERWQRFVSGHTGSPLLSLRTLCVTPKGREAELALLGAPGAVPRHRVAVTCRHHCCEMMVNYTLEGLIEWYLDDTSADAEWLRQNTAWFIVPFVDKDGAEDGDQGKARSPRDHGRDYEGESLYATTAAIRAQLPAWGAGRLGLALDLHCPHISGPHNEVIYVVGSRRPRTAREQQRFSEILESQCRGPLPFSASDFLPFGVDWNSADNYTGGRGFSSWAAELPGMVLSLAMEIPYANARGAEVNQKTAREFGRDLGAAIAAYLKAMG